ncbi:HAMP domain-containing sensor histidine kinase [Streptomyces sp. 900105755]|uniref:HAMP domain-containing sensor histidine kinase n=1 Tax=Streptomyces sp. 900105755 TaxID=3154389 RepID=UPI00332C961F
MSAGPAGPRGPGGPGGPGGSGEEPWGGVRPFSIKTKLGALVVVSVLITTGLSIVAVHTKTELRFITVFSMIATLLITQFVAHSLTAPLDDMNAVARSISQGDYTRRVRENRRDELGDLAETINVMADELEAQDRQRKELVANVSHELRTPIAGLRAVLENVVDGIAEPDTETMRTALKQTERLGRLVETLLDLSRLDNGVVPLRQRRFEVWPYLSGVLKEANMVAGARGGMASGSGNHTRKDVHLHLDVSPPELTAHADPERIHQVVANLIDNAVKHSPAHGRVTVRARRGPQPESLELEVLDEGPGIPRSEWHRVFERFNRGSVRRPHGPGSDGGTGLGLAIARWAVDLHGGRIGVAESDRGCRIIVTLPGLSSIPG